MFPELKLILFCGSAFAVSLILAVCVFVVATSSIYPIIYRSKKEKYFVEPATGKSIPFPHITEAPDVNLSVVIPAYNEEERLPPMLDECIEFLEQRTKDGFKYEILVVSDGSKDNTVKVATEYCRKYTTDKFRILDLEKNRGKGGAVRLGMQSARGAFMLFADADGATKFSDLTKLEESLTSLIDCDYIKNPNAAAQKLGITIGSRAHMEEEAIATRSFIRTILMHGFHVMVWLFTVRGLRDTQCGFKLMTRGAAEKCFESLHVERWAFDVEMLYIAQRLKIPITEIAVNWTEIDGSKVTPFWSWIQMGRDLVLIWLRYTIGAWKIVSLKNQL